MSQSKEEKKEKKDEETQNVNSEENKKDTEDNSDQNNPDENNYDKKDNEKGEPQDKNEPEEKDHNINIKFDFPKVDENKDYKPDEVKELLKKVQGKTASTVKDQLYGEIEKLKGELKEMKDRPKNDNEKQELEQKLKVVEDAYVETKNQVDELKNKMTQKELESYRNKKVAENKGTVIEEMIGGNSQEEIDASVEKAKKAYKEMENNIKSRLNIPNDQPLVPEKEEEGKDEDEPVQVNKIRPDDKKAVEEWRKKRDEQLKDVYRRYGFNV